MIGGKKESKLLVPLQFRGKRQWQCSENEGGSVTLSFLSQPPAMTRRRGRGRRWCNVFLFFLQLRSAREQTAVAGSIWGTFSLHPSPPAKMTKGRQEKVAVKNKLRRQRLCSTQTCWCAPTHKTITINEQTNHKIHGWHKNTALIATVFLCSVYFWLSLRSYRTHKHEGRLSLYEPVLQHNLLQQLLTVCPLRGSVCDDSGFSQWMPRYFGTGYQELTVLSSTYLNLEDSKESLFFCSFLGLLTTV